MDDEIRVLRIIRFEVHSVIMLSIHAWMHHENAGFDYSAFTGLEYHRTDGQVGRSASLQYFDVWLFAKAQCTVPSVSDPEGELAILAKLHIAIVNLALIY